LRALILTLLVAIGGVALAETPSVLLLSVDTLRADRLGCYGHELDTSPNIDRLAAQSLVFDDAVCEVPLTAPSMCSMITGRYPREIGLTRNGVRLPEDMPTIAERFQAAGYATWYVQSNWTLKADLSRANRGFDVYDDDFHKGRWGAIKSERPADEVADIALKLLAERDPAKPFFGWAHFTDPHAPYTFRDDFNPSAQHPWRLDRADKVRVQYDSEIRYTDYHIGRLLDALPENTIILFVADHGESLYEHGYLGHGRRLNQPSVHIPLMVRAPKVAPGRSAVPARGCDVGPTLLGLVGLPPLEGAHGVDLIAAPPAMDRIRIIEAYGGAAIALPGVREDMANMPPDVQAVMEKNWKLIVDGNRVELFDLATDPKEHRSAYAVERDRADALLRHLQTWNAVSTRRDDEVRELTDDDLDALRALGYIQ